MNLQPLLISNPILNNQQALRARMQEFGYLFFKGLVSAERVLEVRRDVLRILDKYGVLDQNADLMEGRMGAGPTPTRRDLLPLYREINPLESFNALAHSPEILAEKVVPVGQLFLLIGQLIDGETLVHTRKICRLKYPNDDYDVVLPHQDYFYIRGSLETYTAWLPLDEIDLTLGGLAVAPGSHQRGFLPHSKPEHSHFTGVRPEDADCVWHRSDYSPGDALVFHSLTLHQGLPNRSNRRLSLPATRRRNPAKPPETALCGY